MKNFIHRTVFLILSAYFMSCSEGYDKRMAQVVESWQGREIDIPEDGIFTVQGKDTVEIDMGSYKYTHRVLLYVDSVGCTSCRLQLRAWDQFIAEVDSLTGGSVQFLLYLAPKSIEDARYITLCEDFTRPICIDMENRIEHLNHFPEEDIFHTFLLDRENRVKVVGNPIHNSAIRSMYMKEIGIEKNCENDRRVQIKNRIKKKESPISYSSLKKKGGDRQKYKEIIISE